MFVFIVIFCHLKDNTIIMIKMLMETLYIFYEYRKVGDKPMSCKPGVAGSIPDFLSFFLSLLVRSYMGITPGSANLEILIK